VDGRISNVELAERVRLTPGPCLRRVQRLEASGVIRGYRAVIDAESTGRGFPVMVDVDLERMDDRTVATFEKVIARLDEVVEAHRFFGSPDYLLHIAVADLATYERFLTGSVLTIPGIQKVSSRFTMKVVKSER